MSKEMICIVCPMGCSMTVTQSGSQYLIEGNKCARGESYAVNEMTNPLRTLTTTVAVTGKSRRLPVRTDKSLPKGKILDLMKALKELKVSLPVQKGQVLLENVFGTGVNVISSRTLIH